MAAFPDGRGACWEEVARGQDSRNPSQGVWAAWEGGGEGPVSEFGGRFGERVPGDSSQDAVVIEDAAPGGTIRGTVIFPDGEEVETEFGSWGL